jgi:hypothetical protein
MPDSKNTIDIIVRVLNESAKSGIREVNNSLQTMRQRLDTARRTVEGFQQAFFVVQNTLGRFTADANLLEQSNRKLSASAKLFNLEFESLADTSKTAADRFKLSEIQADELTVAVSRLTANAGAIGKTDEALEALLNTAAAQGLNADQALVAIRQAILELDEGTDKLFQRNPIDLYKKYAASIGTTAAQLTAQQKKLALLNELLETGNKTLGEYNEFLKTGSGIQAIWAVALQKFNAALGTLINDSLKLIVPLLTPILESLASAPTIVKAATIAIVGLGIAVTGLGASFGPVSLGLTALATVGLAVAGALAKTEDEAESLKNIRFTALINELEGLNSVQSLSADQTARRKSIIDQLNSQFPSYIGNLDLERASNDELEGVLRRVNDQLVQKQRLQLLESVTADSREAVLTTEQAIAEARLNQLKFSERMNVLEQLRARLSEASKNSAEDEVLARRQAVEFLESISGNQIGLFESITSTESIISELDRIAGIQGQLQNSAINRAAALTTELEEQTAELRRQEAVVNQIVSGQEKAAEQGKAGITGDDPNAEERRKAQAVQSLILENRRLEIQKRQTVLEDDVITRLNEQQRIERAILQNKLRIATLTSKQSEINNLTQELTVLDERLSLEREISLVKAERKQSDSVEQSIQRLRQVEEQLEIERTASAIDAEEAKLLSTAQTEEQRIRITQAAQIARIEIEESEALAQVTLQEERLQKEIETNRQILEERLRLARTTGDATAESEILTALDLLADQELDIANRTANSKLAIEETYQNQRVAANADANAQIKASNQRSVDVEARLRRAAQQSFVQTIDQMLSGVENLEGVFKGVFASFRRAAVNAFADAVFASNKANSKLTADALSGVAKRSAAYVGEVAKILTTGAAAIAAAIANILRSLTATLGPLGLVAAGALIGQVTGFWSRAKKAVGLATGAIITGPTEAVIGEAGDNEAVIPLNNQGAEFMADTLALAIQKIVPATLPGVSGEGSNAALLGRILGRLNEMEMTVNLRAQLRAMEFFRDEFPAFEKDRLARQF